MILDKNNKRNYEAEEKIKKCDQERIDREKIEIANKIEKIIKDGERQHEMAILTLNKIKRLFVGNNK